MSRNGAGTYSLPSGNPVVTGTTISSTDFNNTMTDLATALTGSVAADGQTPMTGNLPMGSNRVTGMGNGSATTDAAAYGQVNAIITFSTGAVTIPDSATRYVGANAVVSAVESDAYWRAPFAGVVIGMYTQTQTTTAGTRFYTLRKNAADQAMTCSATGAATQASDSTAAHQFSVAVGDVLTCKVQTVGGSDTVTHNVSVAYRPS